MLGVTLKTGRAALLSFCPTYPGLVALCKGGNGAGERVSLGVCGVVQDLDPRDLDPRDLVTSYKGSWLHCTSRSYAYGIPR